MGLNELMAGILLVALLVFAIGHSFIYTFFERKEGMIKRTIENQRGEL